MSREQERSKLEERITVAEQKEKRYADQMKILHREKAELDRKKRNHRLFVHEEASSFDGRSGISTAENRFQQPVS